MQRNMSGKCHNFFLNETFNSFLILVKYDWPGAYFMRFTRLLSSLSFIWNLHMFVYVFHCSKGWWEYCSGSGLHGTPGADDVVLPADSAQVSSHPQGFPFHHQRHHHRQTHREGARVRMFCVILSVVLLTDYLDYVFHKSVNLFFPTFY